MRRRLLFSLLSLQFCGTLNVVGILLIRELLDSKELHAYYKASHWALRIINIYVFEKKKTSSEKVQKEKK